MAKKHFKGYKGKTSAKIIAIGITAGVITLAIAGGTIANKLSDRPQPEHPYDNDYINETNDDSTLNNTLTPEPGIDMGSGYEDYIPDKTLPDLQQPIIPDTIPDIDENLSVEFVEVLAKLTSKSKDYITSVTGTTPNLTISGLTSMTINSNNNEVVLLGQVKVGDNFNHFVATMANVDNSLAIYNLPSDEITETAFINALDELVSSESTSFKLQLKQYITLSNSSEVIEDMLQNRLDDLIALNSTDQTVLNEISHLNSLLKDTSKLTLNVLFNSRQPVEDGYSYSFNIAVNTGKYLYSSDLAVNSSRVLTTTALKHSIEDYLSTNSDYTVNAIYSSSINQALYMISDTAFNFKNEATLNQ